MPANIETLKIKRNGTLKLDRDYDYSASGVGTGTPGRAGQIDTTLDTITLADGVTSDVVKGLIVEQTTSGEDQNKISILADEAEVSVHNASLESGVHFTNGAPVYHNASALLTPTSGTGNQMGTSLCDLYSNSGGELDMLTRSAQEIAND